MNDITKELDIMSQERFNQLLQNKLQGNVSYIDAVLDICEKTGLEVESVPRLLNSKTKKLIKNEAANLNLLKKKTKRLPI